MRFEVPQFIDVEDKIFGPLTLKQFIYLAGGVGLGYVCYKVAPFPLSWILGIVFIAAGGVFAFYKINNRPFIAIAQSYLAYRLKNRLYIWRRAPIQKQIDKPAPVVVVPPPVREINEKTAATLAKNLDILDSNN
ncbi:MAG: seg [Patescibacteria group bacterium]|nr:seg [Patescibacteria group bacterium]